MRFAIQHAAVRVGIPAIPHEMTTLVQHEEGYSNPIQIVKVARRLKDAVGESPFCQSNANTRSALLCIRTRRRSRLNYGVGRFRQQHPEAAGSTGTKVAYEASLSLRRQASYPQSRRLQPPGFTTPIGLL